MIHRASGFRVWYLFPLGYFYRVCKSIDYDNGIVHNKVDCVTLDVRLWVGVTKAPFANLSFKSTYVLWITFISLTGVTTAKLRFHLSNRNVVFHMEPVFWLYWKIETLTELRELLYQSPRLARSWGIGYSRPHLYSTKQTCFTKSWSNKLWKGHGSSSPLIFIVLHIIKSTNS